MRLQANISISSYEKIVSWKAKQELKGRKMNMHEATESFIQNAKIEE